MIQLYDRDAAAGAVVLTLVVALRRADIGQLYPHAAEALRGWDSSDVVEADVIKKRALIDARLESIVAAIEEQLGAHA